MVTDGGCYFESVAARKKAQRRLAPEARAFHSHLRTLLTLKAMKPAELSRRSGIAPPLLSRFLDGTRRPDLNTLLRLANGLDISLDRLVGREWPVSNSGASETVTVIEPGFEHQFSPPERRSIRPQQQPGKFTGSPRKVSRSKRLTE